MPSLKELADKYGKDGLVVIAPSLDAQAQVKQFKEKQGLNFAVLAEAEPDSTAYQVDGFPTIILVDKKGIIRWRGYEKDAAFYKLVEQVLKE